MTLKELKIKFKEQGDFKYTFEWYLPVSCKLKIADLIARGHYATENQAVYEALQDLFKKRG